MKKILSVIVATAMIATMLTACGGNATETSNVSVSNEKTAATGSDDRGSDETADVPASGDAPADGGTVSSTPTTFEEKNSGCISACH